MTKTKQENCEKEKETPRGVKPECFVMRDFVPPILHPVFMKIRKTPEGIQFSRLHSKRRKQQRANTAAPSFIHPVAHKTDGRELKLTDLNRGVIPDCAVKSDVSAVVTLS